jgi:D-alanyl-D-alanine dipeptidase
MMPVEFVYVDQVIPTDLRYRLSDNFLGRPVNGYLGTRAILTRPAAQALAKIQAELHRQGLGLLILDAYRPQRAVDHFVEWAKDLSDTKKKESYYPDVHKTELFAQGYIAARSGHSRGSTVDVTVVSLSLPHQQLDMGSSFDFFGQISWFDATGLSSEQQANRSILKSVMVKHGFIPYNQEWWHFTLSSEPFPDTYFDFEIRDDY